MNKLIIIGNGFDLAHDLKTKYSDMINFFRENFIDDCQKLVDSPNYVFGNNLYRIEKRSNSIFNLRQFNDENGLEETLAFVDSYFNYEISNEFLDDIININNINTWVDVENEYYKNVITHLETSKKHGKSLWIRELNESFEDIKKLLEKHLLNEMKKSLKMNPIVLQNILRIPDSNELLSNFAPLSLNNILIVNFNYTDTVEKIYLRDLKQIAARNFCSVNLIHIHGDINDFKVNPMIFGYGDELDHHSKEIVDFNDSEFLKNIKSINYQFSSNYKKVLQFLSQDKFQVVIMGHSCGNSDRTLLNTIFENDNCVSIKPYYHAWDGGDNYFEIVCNIYRNFTKNYSFREKVVEKNLCETLT